MVLKQFKNIKLVPWETCNDLILSEEQAKILFRNTESTLGKFHKESNEMFMRNDKRYYLVDVLTTVVVIDPSAIVESFSAYGMIETTNSMSKGMIQYYKLGSLPHLVAEMQQKYNIDCS